MRSSRVSPRAGKAIGRAGGMLLDSDAASSPALFKSGVPVGVPTGDAGGCLELVDRLFLIAGGDGGVSLSNVKAKNNSC